MKHKELALATLALGLATSVGCETSQMQAVDRRIESREKAWKECEKLVEGTRLTMDDCLKGNSLFK